MPNLEKVIKGLECCTARNGDCKYKQEPICPYVESCRAKDYSALKRDALELLKEQKAVKPVRDKETGRIWLCGNCGTYVGFEDHDENDPNEFDKYCRVCGHPVLWKGR